MDKADGKGDIMVLQTGEHVIYRNTELCRVEGFEKQCADGVHEREYCVLTPVNSAGARYYVPAETAAEKLRAVHTREEIMSLISEMGAAEDWCPDPMERKRRHAEVLSSGDILRTAAMVKGIYLERRRREEHGKSLNSADERTLRAAEDMINGEFSFVLGIKPEDVPAFISGKIG